MDPQLTNQTWPTTLLDLSSVNVIVKNACSNSAVNLKAAPLLSERRTCVSNFQSHSDSGIQYLSKMASISPSSSNTSPSAADLTKQLRLHKVAIDELNNPPSSRAYHRNGNLFFRTTIQTATEMQQKQLESAKAKLKSLNSS